MLEIVKRPSTIIQKKEKAALWECQYQFSEKITANAFNCPIFTQSLTA